MLVGSPTSIPSAAATSGDAGSAAQVSSTVPGSSPIAAIIDETPKLRLRSFRISGRSVT